MEKEGRPSLRVLSRTSISPASALWLGALLALPLSLSLSCAPASAKSSYHAIEPWARLPDGQQWQAMSAVDIDAHGRIYVLQRGEPSKVMIFARRGRLLGTWGEGTFPDAHGLRIDRDGNVWITDRKLQQVLKFTRDGKPLLAIGTRGISGDNASRTSLNGPSDIAFAKNGDVFVTDGESSNARVMHYDRGGKLLTFWGSKGTGQGQLNVPHAIVIDSRSRLYVADRTNNRVEIFDQTGVYQGEIRGVGAPFGLAIDARDILYVADGSKGAESLTIVDTRDGHVLDHFTDGLEGAHMLAVDRQGAIYVAEARGRSIRKFVR